MKAEFQRYLKIALSSGVPQESLLFHAPCTATWQLILGNLSQKQNSKVFGVTLEKLHSESYVSFKVSKGGIFIVMKSGRHLPPSRLPTLGIAFCEKPNDMEQLYLHLSDAGDIQSIIKSTLLPSKHKLNISIFLHPHCCHLSPGHC